MTYEISEQVTVRFKRTTCCVCAQQFMMSADFFDRRMEDGDWFYCPLGHSQHFTKSTAARLQSAEEALSQLRSQLQLEQDQKAATQKSLELLRKRIGAGVCPACHRSVSQLKRHIKSKHPHWVLHHENQTSTKI